MPKCFPSDVSPTNWLFNRVEEMSKPDQNFFVRELATRLFGLVAAAPCGVLSSTYNLLALSKTPISVCVKIAFPCDPIEDVIGKEFKVSELCKHSYKIFAYVFSAIFSPLLTFVYPRFSIWLHEKTLLKEAVFLPPAPPPPPFAPPLPNFKVPTNNPGESKQATPAKKEVLQSSPTGHAAMIAEMMKQRRALCSGKEGLSPEEIEAKIQKNKIPKEENSFVGKFKINEESYVVESEDDDDEDEWEFENLGSEDNVSENPLKQVVVAYTHDKNPPSAAVQVQPGILKRVQMITGGNPDVSSFLANPDQRKAAAGQNKIV